MLIGPSGCGKSTFLRCLNQLEIADSGRITIGGVTIEGGHAPRNAAEREQQRRLRLQAGMVFQSFNLFPHLTVLQNITRSADGRQRRGASRGRNATRANCWPRSASKTRPTPIRRNFPADSNSGWPSRAHWRCSRK